MEPKKRNPRKKIESAHCACSENTGLFVPNRQLSFVVSGGIITLFFVFIIGFFGGQRYAISQFSYKLNQDSFADQIYSSLYTLGEHDIEDEQYVDDTENKEDENKNIEPVQSEENTIKILQSSDITEPVINQPAKAESRHMYYAPLIGFGTVRAAQRFTQRLVKQGYSVYMKKIRSKTARGKKVISWYQVVTEPCEDKAMLEALVQRIVQQEKLKDVHIKTV